jgi:NAD(P)-dependent dehydrogenase (short-subunit alcohol dehydrogenase family)
VPIPETEGEMSLEGRRALVTGGSRNLGPVVAEHLARAGARVVVTYLTAEDAARALVEDLAGRYGGAHHAIRADLSADGGTTAAVEEAIELLGGVDILVNNVGPFSKTPFVDMPPSEWDRVWDANVKAVYLAARAAAPSMRRDGWGRIVNFSAVSASVRNRSVYGLSKAAVEVLTEELALELAPEITVNALAPGQIRESLDEMSGIDPSWAEAVTRATPLRRLVTRDEVAELVTMLCLPVFDAVTGVTIPVDGGLRLPRL